MVLFLGISFISKAKENLKLDDETKIILYPDQIRIDDGWFSGQGKIKGQKVLVSGNINQEQETKFKRGYTFEIGKITGEMESIQPATNLGEFDYRAYYAGKNIYHRIKINHFEIIAKENNIVAKCHTICFNLQQYFKKMPKLLSFFSSELILAENNLGQDQEIMNNYRDLGIIHLLSISGLHVGIYTLVLSIILYYLKFTEPQVFICCGIFLLIEIFLSNGQAGFIRASLTYLIGEFFSLKKLKISGYDLLGLTCLIHLVFVPKLFIGTGAILSYLLALGLQLTKSFSKFWQSVSLNLILTPLLLIYFFQVNLLTILFNLFAIPYFNFIVLPATFANLILFNINPKFSEVIEQILIKTESFFGALAKTKLGLLTFGKISWWQCLLLLLLTLIIIAYCCYEFFNKKVAKQLIFGLSMSYLICFGMIHFPLWGQVSFIDVGQGDSILITTPFPRKVYMIDTGGKLNFSGKKTTPQVEKITIPLLKAQGITQIDGLFVSHQDADHVGDIGPLMEKIPVKRLYMAKGLLNNSSFRKRIDGKVNHTDLVELLAGMEIKIDRMNFKVVYPFKPGEGKNEDSLSLTFALANKRWLFTGDLGQEGEQELISRFGMKVNYFKLGHHGSKTSSNPEFLKAINPDLVFISAGRNNRFGHPHQETLNTLKSLDVPWVSTQDYGMISWYYGFQKPHFESYLMEQQK